MELPFDEASFPPFQTSFPVQQKVAVEVDLLWFGEKQRKRWQLVLCGYTEEEAWLIKERSCAELEGRPCHKLYFKEGMAFRIWEFTRTKV